MNDSNYELKSARYLADEMLGRVLRPGDAAVDATMGNGHDTLFLCEAVGFFLLCDHIGVQISSGHTDINKRRTLKIDLLIFMTRVIVTDHFDETAVTRAAAVANHNTMASLVQLAGSA